MEQSKYAHIIYTLSYMLPNLVSNSGAYPLRLSDAPQYVQGLVASYASGRDESFSLRARSPWSVICRPRLVADAASSRTLLLHDLLGMSVPPKARQDSCWARQSPRKSVISLLYASGALHPHSSARAHPSTRVSPGGSGIRQTRCEEVSRRLLVPAPYT